MARPRGLFPLYLRADLRVYTRVEVEASSWWDPETHGALGRNLRAGTRVEVLDIFSDGFYVLTPYGKMILGRDELRPPLRRVRSRA